MARVFEDDKSVIRFEILNYMIRLLLVGDASSIFFVNYVRALKEQIKIEVTVYSPIIERFSNDNYPYDYVYFDNYGKSWLSKIRFFGTRLQPFFNRIHLGSFLKNENKQYDIIHVHWVIPGWVIFPSFFKKYGKSFGSTLWGGELESLKILNSHKLYLYLLKKYFSYNDFLIGSYSIQRLYDFCPFLKDKCFYAIYGSSIIDELSKLKTTTSEAKDYFNIPRNKITILLGYSGKTIHRHIEIINGIIEHPLFQLKKDDIHFMASMTRGATVTYIKDVKDKLNASGCTYTVIENTYQTDEDVALFRKATDIAFQLSEYDGLSNSIKEILTAGTIMICGNWFPNYNILKEEGFSYIEVENIKEGVDIFYKILDDESVKKEIRDKNSNVGYKKYLWSESIKDFIKVYNQLSGK